MIPALMDYITLLYYEKTYADGDVLRSWFLTQAEADKAWFEDYESLEEDESLTPTRERTVRRDDDSLLALLKDYAYNATPVEH